MEAAVQGSFPNTGTSDNVMQRPSRIAGLIDG
jgi:hypothetical protein